MLAWYAIQTVLISPNLDKNELGDIWQIIIKEEGFEKNTIKNVFLTLS